MTKICTKCRVEQDLSNFARQKGGKFGRRACCQSCCTARLRDYRRCRPGYSSEILKRAYRRNPEKIKAANQAYRRTPKGWAVKTWNKLNQRTVNGTMPNWKNRACRHYLAKGVRLEMQKQEFYAWVEKNWSTAEAIFVAGGVPSVDRIDSDGHYALGNIRIIENAQNCANGRMRAFVRYRRASDRDSFADREGPRHDPVR